MSDTILQLTDISKNYKDIQAVDKVNLCVRQGEIFGFLGPNGPGKTTTIGMILGLIHPSDGKVEVFGKEVKPNQTQALKRVRSLVGAPGLIPYLSGRENLNLLVRFSPVVNHRQIQEIIEQVGLDKAADRPYKSYSTGMKQRLGLAAALINNPQLLILDEPTNGLDPAGMKQMRELIRTEADSGVTVFLSSHLLHEVEQLCDRVAILNQGRVIALDSVQALLNRYTGKNFESIFLELTQ